MPKEKHGIGQGDEMFGMLLYIFVHRRSLNTQTESRSTPRLYLPSFAET